MELREFVSETIQQVSLGVKDAMDKCSELDVIVNPDITVGADGDFYVPKAGSYPMQRRVQLLDMDIAVTVTETSETSGGGKIGVSIFGANINSSGKSENTNVSRVKFSIPVCFPISKVEIKRKSNPVGLIAR